MHAIAVSGREKFTLTGLEGLWRLLAMFFSSLNQLEYSNDVSEDHEVNQIEYFVGFV